MPDEISKPLTTIVSLLLAVALGLFLSGQFWACILLWVMIYTLLRFFRETPG
jgi:hypothetical protein